MDMDEIGFRNFLKRAGKKEHVIDGLTSQVLLAESYFLSKGIAGLEDASKEAIQKYAKNLPRKALKARMRGLALYYHVIGKAALAKLAGQLREQEIAKTRKSFRIRHFRGTDMEAITKLESIDINTVDDILVAGRTPQLRQQLAEQTGIAPETILELVKLSDLSRIGAVKRVRARLYYEAGLDTPDKFKQWEPDDLRQMLVKFVAQTGFEGIAPLPREVENAIMKARKLPQVVVY